MRAAQISLNIFGEKLQHKPLLILSGCILGRRTLLNLCNSEQLALTSRNEDALVQTINARCNEKYPDRHKMEIVNCAKL